MLPGRLEQIRQYVEVLFRPEQARLAAEQRQALAAAQHKARQTNNAGAMIPAEAESYVLGIRALSTAKAVCIACAYTDFQEPAGPEAERDLLDFHQRLVGVRRSVFIAAAEQTARITNSSPSSQLSSAASGFVSGASPALDEGRKILAQQRVRMENQPPYPVARPTFMLDTCVFNWLADGRIRRSDLPYGGLFALTHVQLDEINKTKDEDRRARLFIIQTEMECALVPTETFVADVSRVGRTRQGAGEAYGKLKTDLDAANGCRASNIQDALIAETAMVNGHTLITADRDLKTVTVRSGGTVLFLDASAT